MDHVFTPSTSTSTSPHDSRLRSSFRFYHPHSPPASSPPQLRPDKPFSLQTRRLQLRNAGFRAPQLPGRRISDHFAAWRSPSGGCETHTDDQNSPGSSLIQDYNSGLSSRRRVSVLQEICNSAERRRRYSSRPSVAALFEDVARDSNEDNSNTGDLLSPHPPKERGTWASPIPFDQSDDSDTEHAMKSRDQSTRGGSPLLRDSSVSRRKRRDYRRQTAGYGTTRYIEHLEAQLAASQDQLDSVNSSAARPHIRRLRSLNAEIRMLKQEIAEWESKFEARVREELGSWTETESKLKSRIRVLEGQLEADNRRIKELEHEKEVQAQKLRNTEALSSTNRILERRIDVLTELLAQSPTRLEPPRNSAHRSDTVSPGGPRRSRPRSMMPFIPSPRSGGLFQLPVIPDAKAVDHLNDGSDPHAGGAGSRRGSQQESVFDDQAKPDFASECTSTSSVSRDSTFLPSAPRSHRSSISQHSSASSASLPFPLSPDSISKFQSRHRKMRRFPSGSCTLKPLILPVAAGDHHSPSPHQHDPSPPHESHPSFNPAPGFLDDHTYDSPSEAHGCSPSWAQQESLNALEGRTTSYCETFEEAISRHGSAMSSSDVSPSLGQRLDVDLDNALRSRLYEETIPEESDDSYSEISPPAPIFEASQDHSANEHRDHMPKILLSSADDYSETPTRRPWSKRWKYQSNKDKAPKAKETVPTTATTRHSPVAGVATGQAVGILSRYAFYFKELQRRPTELARRVIANAWHSNWKRLGKLSWWVLGLFLGPQSRDGGFKKPTPSGADSYDWHRYSGAIHLKHSTLLGHPPVTAHGRRPDAGGRLDDEDSCGDPRTQHTIQHETPESSLKEPTTATSSFGRSLCLWAKFSFAIVLAIGLAVKNGPGTLLEDCPHGHSCSQCHRNCKEIEQPNAKLPPSYHGVIDQCRGDGSDISGSTAIDEEPPQKHGWMPTFSIGNFLTG
ncbi:hypothetical protein M432DRAFT_393687 [Thermoascus aurantiacus ATCC 26904]